MVFVCIARFCDDGEVRCVSKDRKELMHHGWDTENYVRHSNESSVQMQRISYPTETDLSYKFTRNIIVLSFIQPRKPLRQRPMDGCGYGARF